MVSRDTIEANRQRKARGSGMGLHMKIFFGKLWGSGCLQVGVHVDALARHERQGKHSDSSPRDSHVDISGTLQNTQAQ